MKIYGYVVWVTLGLSSMAQAESTGAQYLQQAQAFYQKGKFFQSARYAFAAQERDPSLRAEAYAWVSYGLFRANLKNAASYFFIRTLQTANKAATRKVLVLAPDFLEKVGSDFLSGFLVKNTSYEDYTPSAKDAYLITLGKTAVLAGKYSLAVQYLNGIQPSFSSYAHVLQLRATARVLQRDTQGGIEDFKMCVELASRKKGDEAEDLKTRCQAGIARILYQMEQFEEADWAYDEIPKESLVWPDILFEQGWNAFGRQQYNRSLGKLVSYKSPALRFVYNPEIDTLRAQSYLLLCYYGYADQAISEFDLKYTKLGQDVKRFVEQTKDLGIFYDFGKKAAQGPLDTQIMMDQMANRFVRTPYFRDLLRSEKAVQAEWQSVHRFTGGQVKGGFPAFLKEVLAWRLKAIRQLGGIFIKNSLMDYHAELIAQFEKIAFIKLEMLNRTKQRILRQPVSGERYVGNSIPRRRDDQYFWSFNGEFWNDELGDYIFGLESQCQSSSRRS